MGQINNRSHIDLHHILVLGHFHGLDSAALNDSSAIDQNTYSAETLNSVIDYFLAKLWISQVARNFDDLIKLTYDIKGIIRNIF